MLLDWPIWLLFGVQATLAARSVTRMLLTARGIPLRDEPCDEAETVSVIVPVLNEAARLTPCLEGLIAAAATVREILVVDGGSTDGTQALIATFAARDPRVRVIDAAPVPSDWNGKAWGLECGLRASNTASRWIATIDADIAPAAHLVPALVAQALRERVGALSIATTQTLGDLGEGLLHPSMLTAMVYRFGLPGNAATRPEDVQANGQCFLAERALLLTTDAIARAKDSRCEDVAIARTFVRAGERVGFYEAGGLVSVRMYANWRETWTNWPRSLAAALTGEGLADALLIQALPPWIALAVTVSGTSDPTWRALFLLDVVLSLMRLGILAGTARAYRNPPWTYWLSPLADLPVAFALLASALRRWHTWRGRALVASKRSS
jgi:dolichol-phosphate mannosyltransferase